MLNDAENIMEEHVVQQVVLQHIDQVRSKCKKKERPRLKDQEGRVEPKHRDMMNLALWHIPHKPVEKDNCIGDDEKGGYQLVIRTDGKLLNKKQIINPKDEVSDGAEREVLFLLTVGLTVVKPPEEKNQNKVKYGPRYVPDLSIQHERQAIGQKINCQQPP